MAFDLAIDFRTGDFILSPSGDISGRSGEYVLLQRVHVRLLIERGRFIYDSTGGRLGSRLHELLRGDANMALAQAQMIVNEALAPMEDIEVLSVDVEPDPDNPRQVLVHVTFKPAFNPADAFQSAPVASQSLTLTL